MFEITTLPFDNHDVGDGSFGVDKNGFEVNKVICKEQLSDYYY